MKVLWTLFGACGFMLFVSCSKDSLTGTQPVEMSFDGIETVAPMQVFTDGGITIDPETNPTTVQYFLAEQYSRTSATGMTFYNSGFRAPVTETYQQVHFYFDEQGNARYATKIVSEEQYDEATVMISTVSNAIEDNPIMASDLFKYPYRTQSDGRYTYQYVVHRSEREALDVSLLYYKLVRYDEEGRRTQLAWGTVHNEFNDSFLESLGKRDTLAVEAYRLKYSTKP